MFLNNLQSPNTILGLGRVENWHVMIDYYDYYPLSKRFRCPLVLQLYILAVSLARLFKFR